MNTTKTYAKRWPLRRLALAAALCLSAIAATPTAASGAIQWHAETIWAPTPVQTGNHGQIWIDSYNQGDTTSQSQFGVPSVFHPFVTPAFGIKVDLPPGVTFDGTVDWEPGPAEEATCPIGVGTESFSCLSIPDFGHYGRQQLRFGFDVAPGVTGTHPYTVTVGGGGAPSYVENGQLTIHDEGIFGPGFTPGTFKAGSYDEAENDFTQAGGFPFQAIGAFDVNLGTNGSIAGGNPRHILTDLPRGFIGNVTAVPPCPNKSFEEGANCPPESQIGVIRILGDFQQHHAVYNLQPPAHIPAEFGFQTDRYNIRARPVVRADNGYAIQLQFLNVGSALDIPRVKFIVWGVPGDSAHDNQRCHIPNDAAFSNPADPVKCNGHRVSGSLAPPSDGRHYYPSDFEGEVKPFLSNPTNCHDTPTTRIHLSLWGNPGPVDNLSDPRWDRTDVESPNVTDCDDVPFEPTIDFEPTTRRADSPTGLNADLHIPQDGWEDPEAIATAHLKKTVVKLPAGMAFNASAANGLEACTPEQIGLVSAAGEVPYRFDNREPSCPSASKIANATVTTPVLHDKLKGEVFLASQDRNPFGSTYAIYIVVREPSILVKLPGRVDLDPATGQITTTFDQNPQLPFSDLRLEFFGGPRAALATPTSCGNYTVQNRFVPWSAADPDNPTASEVVSHPDGLSINQGAGGGGCPGTLPFDVGLEAGSSNPIAGAHSPFSIRILRPDGSQELDRLEISPPVGFLASLKGMPYCSEAAIASAPAKSGRSEQASPSCPKASEVGSTLAGAGAGPAPFFAPGKVYLSGPYKGAPLSVVAITPAIAGPFDLGNVVVRSALHMDPRTAKITAFTDPLPRTIDGVPLRIKDLRIDLDRPNWALNPTSCEEKSVELTAHGTSGAVTRTSNRFAVGGCQNLGFKPRLSIQLKGGTKRGDYPALRAVLNAKPGDANIARAAVTLPRSAFLEQAHIRTICTRVQFAADACPKAAIYGYARATTPLLDDPVQGPVYLRSSDNKLPDLVADLQGQVSVELVGRIDSVRGGLRNTFDVVPDAPVTKFVLTMQGGKKGLVVNSTNLCASTNRANARFVAQNGRRLNFRPKVVPVGCGKGRKAGKGKR